MEMSQIKKQWKKDNAFIFDIYHGYPEIINRLWKEYLQALVLQRKINSYQYKCAVKSKF